VESATGALIRRADRREGDWGEIVGGLEASASRETSWQVARRKLGKLVCWPFDKPAAYEHGRIFADLKRRGRVIQQVDM
jgi:predicted nucleic acid-binding protein